MPDFFSRKQKLLLHLSFWAMYASYFLFIIGAGRPGRNEWASILPDFCIHLFGMLKISYVNYYHFLPRLLNGGSIRGYLIRFLPVFFLLATATLLAKQLLIEWILVDGRHIFGLPFILTVYISAIFVVVFVSLIQFLENYFELQAKSQELEKEQLSSELRFLKAQVNPHFLFNTLNNLYYLAVNQSAETPEVIAKLSGIMRYMIHESNTSKVALEKEINYMENYLDLQRLRLNEEIPITFEVSGDLTQVRIVPLILITFLENAFKHGIGNGRPDSWITVSLSVDHGKLFYQVTNSKQVEADKTVREPSGLGLANVFRRLTLSYPNRHELTVTEDQERYKVNLEIEY